VTRPIQWSFKRIADLVLGLVVLVVLAPLLVAIALAILAESGRPVLFLTDRAGQGGRPFRMVKFRTMIPGAIGVGRRMRLSDDPFGIVPNDPRVTRVGRWLRRTGLDELPQLWNVLRGEMSLVGPRPDLVEQVANYEPAERRRLSVPPGLTGLAQVQGRDQIPWPERFRLDLWYVDNWSLALDGRILLRTVRELFRGEPMPVTDRMNIERARAKRAPKA
jgi:lipopolysaccharide/colanic/teichoic acid biosynthesis glycosyltransferase